MQALSHRNNLAEVSEVKLNFRGSTAQPFVNLRQLTMIWCSVDQQELSQRLFDSHTLKHLTLINQAFSCRNSCTPNTAWDLPALETLKLACIRLGDGTEKNLNLFSKCVNLKDITLHRCSMKGVEVFNVCVPHLSSFTITEASVLPKVCNMDVPQLQTLTASASVSSCTEGLNSCSNFLHLSTTGFSALEKVIIFLSNSRFRKERHVPSLLELFRILRTVKFLILDIEVIESLSSCLDHISHEPCSFDNLKCLKINTTPLKQRDRMPRIPIQVRNYLLENSPNATFIMDLPKVPQKRSLLQAHSDAATKKVAKLEAEEKLPATMTGQMKIQMHDQVIAQQKEKIQAQFQVDEHQLEKIRMQDQIIAQQKAKIRMHDQIIAKHKTMFRSKIQMQEQVIAKLKDMLEAQNLQHEKLISHIIKCKMAELKLQIESGNPDYEVIHSVEADIKSVMNLIPSSLRANVDAEFSSQYEELKRVLLTRINASRWSMIETGLGIIRRSEGSHSNHSHSESHVHAAEHPAAPGLPPAN